MLKIAKTSARFGYADIGEHHPWCGKEITERLEAMGVFIQNGQKSRQRKSKQNNTLDGIINSLAA